MKKSVMGACVLMMLVASVTYAAEPVKIGFISVLSGPLAPIGKSEENAAVMAVEEFGPVLGQNGTPSPPITPGATIS
jgi:ABC-type branched-subunit amino acid transport system substrate-binding protein